MCIQYNLCCLSIITMFTKSRIYACVKLYNRMGYKIVVWYQTEQEQIYINTSYMSYYG